MRDLVAVDYAHTLPPHERSWLASFNEAEYGGDPDQLKFITGRAPSQEEKRRLWREIKRYQRNAGARAFAHEAMVGLRGVDPSEALIDWIDTDDHRFELIVLENLKFMILRKPWQAA